ncbi:helix-turn-helix transcriptional regulator [Kitasatospora saccharophila]|uniref:Helix-turn-helix transcriptional regulator n=1 Tax=Kitasatospora saccharophila TaxID=407973 RepID=A0ABN2W797_9ACTN
MAAAQRAAAPQVRYRRAAVELQRLRKERGESASDVVAAIAGMNLVKLSRYENAQVQLKPDVVKALLDHYECDPALAEVLLEGLRDNGRPGWVAGYGDLNPLHQDLIRLEETAVGNRSYEQSYIPGLLQTRRYAHAIIASGVHQTPSVEERVEVRINRQAVLTRATNPLKLWAVIHESALSMKVSDGVMEDQLDRLIQWSALPNITIQIMPAMAPPHPGMSGPFTLLEFPHRDLDLVLLSDMISSRWVEKAAEVETFRTAFDEIMATALGLDDSLKLIREKREQLK